MRSNLLTNHTCVLAMLALLTPDYVAAQSCNCNAPDPAESHVGLSYEGDRVYVAGVLVDLVSEQPLRHAQVSTPGGSGSPEVGTLSDSLGWFRYSIQARDSVHITIALIGYSPVSLVLTPRASSKSFVMLESVMSSCPFIVTGRAESVPEIRVTLRDVRTGEPTQRPATLKIYDWHGGEVLRTQVTGSGTAVPSTLQTPGVYTLTAEAEGYRPTLVRKVLIRRDPCNSAFLLAQHIDAWLIPVR
jgi:hypothetical protein